MVSGGTAAQALRNTIDLAKHTEQFGYRRYWLAEHHLVPGVAASSPPVLTALVASATSTIRVGSAAVLLGNHSPLVVAEQFGTVAQVYPNRIDVGLGRAGLGRSKDFVKRFAEPEAESAATRDRIVEGLLVPGRPTARINVENVIDRLSAQQRLIGDRGEDASDYDTDVRRVLGFFEGTYREPDGTEHHSVTAEGADVEFWIVGSSAGPSSAVAGSLGLWFGANYHVSPSTAIETAAAYRDAFKPSKYLDRPYVSVSADVVVAEDDATAKELASGYGQWVASIRSGRQGAIQYPTPAEAAQYTWTDDQRASVADRTRTQFVGSPQRVADGLATLRDAVNADEIVVTTITHEHADRVRSYELLAKAWADLA